MIGTVCSFLSSHIITPLQYFIGFLASYFPYFLFTFLQFSLPLVKQTSKQIANISKNKAPKMTPTLKWLLFFSEIFGCLVYSLVHSNRYLCCWYSVCFSKKYWYKISIISFFKELILLSSPTIHLWFLGKGDTQTYFRWNTFG